MNVEIIMKFLCCKSIEILTYDQTYLQLFMWNNGTRKIIYIIYKLVFRPGTLQNRNLDLWP